MTEDIWDEKPKRWEYAELRSAKIMTGTFGLYRASEVDAFHEKLKVEHDLLKEHSGRWLHFVAVDYPEIKKWISPKEIMELIEKADKWDKQMQEDFHEYKKRGYADGALMFSDEKAQLENTLEAVKKYLDTIVIPSVSQITKLKEILEAEG